MVELITRTTVQQEELVDINYFNKTLDPVWSCMFINEMQKFTSSVKWLFTKKLK